MTLSRSLIAKAGAAAVVLAAAGGASVAQARDHVTFSIGANIAPGVAVTASNAPYYYGPAYGAAYVAPAPVYYPPAPVYYQPAPVYYSAAPVIGVQYYWSPVHHRYYYYHHGRRHWR
jgi:hypothetical protein